MTNVIVSHKTAVAEFGSLYRINKEIKAGRLFRVARGFYSDTRHVDPYALCAVRYPGASPLTAPSTSTASQAGCRTRSTSRR